VTPSSALRRATTAVYAVFILSGFAFASWASRIPQVRDALELSPRSLGLVLLAIAVGSVSSMPLSGVVVGRLGTARTIALMALIAAAGLATAGLGYRVGVVPVVVGLFLLGVGNGTWDVRDERRRLRRRAGSRTGDHAALPCRI
jgi:fucose permease